MLKYPLLLYAMLVFQAPWRVAHACPAFCACKWKNGKQTVNCEGRGLTDIPDGLDPGTQVLDFSGNLLNSLAGELFSDKKLINLQRIYLTRCKIRTINDRTFKGLTNLVELDLSDNLMETVPSGSFADCPSLMRLTLSSNPIKALKKLAFGHLSFLSTLELTGCEVEEIEEGAFHGLHSLEWLYLGENKLKAVRGLGTLPENLKGVELRGNVWECDCHIKDFYIWLKNYKVPISVEPTCKSPSRLAGRVIKSIPPAELACLPDVSPTTFYLELAEGKNVSLLCHVHAVPEASVSWWFQGQILQNNTIVAPGIHLIYFVEEGSENKRSELFIYNANPEDNGTFVCNAENAAGASQSNFTIRIIIKEDPIVIIVSFPFEHLLAAAIGAGVLGLVIITIILVSIVRYRRRIRRQAKRKKAKDATSQYRESVGKGVAQPEEAASPPNPLKTSSDEEMTLYNARHPGDDVLNAVSSVAVAPNQDSPSSLGRYQLEQNPDLINGTESAGGPDHSSPILRQAAALCLQTNLEWGRGHFVDVEGYPVDYGLPKPAGRSQPGENYYRTLPCNRMRRQSARTRYSQEAELLTRSLHPHPYDHYHTNVRYTADGYPAPQPLHEGMGPASLPCCSVPWPACVPANVGVAIINPAEYNPSKRSASAQTDTQNEDETKIDPHTIGLHNDSGNEVLTESPDEGYEGEPSVV